jgi:hypothetical protein
MFLTVNAKLGYEAFQLNTLDCKAKYLSWPSLQYLTPGP